MDRLTESVILAQRINRANVKKRTILKQYCQCFTSNSIGERHLKKLRNKIDWLDERLVTLSKKLATIIIVSLLDDDVEAYDWVEFESRKKNKLHVSYGNGKKFSYPHGHVVINTFKLRVEYARRAYDDHGPQNATNISLYDIPD